MARYWVSSFLCFISIKTEKKRTTLISSHLDRKSLVNIGFIIEQKHRRFITNQDLFISRDGKGGQLFLRGITAGSPEPILPAQVPIRTEVISNLGYFP